MGCSYQGPGLANYVLGADDGMKSASPPVVVYEDRPGNLIGVQLLVLSLNRYSPDLRALVTVPGAPEAFRDWLQAQPNAELYDTRLEASGWDVKPSLLLEHLGNGSPSVAWVDSDMIVTGHLSARLAELPTGSLIGTEDVWWGRRQGTPQRTLAWGLKPGRVLPVTVNTGFLRAATAHVPLLERWRDMLTMPDYRAAQKLEIDQRPLHLMGDQEVLTALLGAVDWQDVPVRLLRRGLDVAQCYGPGGFSPRERLYLRLHHQLPLLVHAMGPKPWAPKAPRPKLEGNGVRALVSGGAAAIDAAHHQLSLFNWAASSYREELGNDLAWTSHSTPLSSALVKMTKNDPLLREMPLALMDAARRGAFMKAGKVKAWLGKKR